jgi:hypothetical protein
VRALPEPPQVTGRAQARAAGSTWMFTHMNSMFTHSSNLHDLVIVVAFMGALFSG